jgi:hypothetical protein
LYDNHEDILSDEFLVSLSSAKSSEKKVQRKSRDIIKKFLKNLDIKICKKNPNYKDDELRIKAVIF